MQLSTTLSDFIWRTRYRDPDSRPPEENLEATLDRVARSAAAVESDPAVWSARFAGAFRNLRFIPGGRILAGAGTARLVTLSNCFVMGVIEDSMEGIFQSLKEGALTMQQGGGVGYDFSTLRPRGALARATGAIASGPVSFMRVWDATCATIISTNARRGAMMATLRCDHPDIEEFIDAKRPADSLRNFNLSVLITDAFMRAVKDDAPWPLVFPAPGTSKDPSVVPRIWKTVRAREVWTKLCDSAYDCAEPGVLFIDRINEENNLGYCETLSTTNPCAEEPLPPYGACNLGSLNVTAFVIDPFAATARLDWTSLRETTAVAVRLLDDAVDISRYPLPQQRDQAHRTRRIGVGITGLADALAMLRLRYDSESARTWAANLMREIRDAAYGASVKIAEDKGPFPAFDPVHYLQRPFIRRLPAEIQAGIRQHGIRNSHLLAIAPTGTISLLAGNVSSGIEPIFAVQSVRSVLDTAGREHRFQATDYAYALRSAATGRTAPLEDYFIQQDAVAPSDHLLMQAALQPFVDGGISKTIRLSSSVTRSSVSEILESAYNLGVKGCTVFREGARRSVILDQSAAPPTPRCEASTECTD